MKEFKKGLALLKYSYNFKTQVILALAFFVLGIVFEVADISTSSYLGGFYLMLAASYISQMLMSVCIGDFALASPYRKKLQTIVPALLPLPFSIFSFTIVVVSRYLKLQANPENASLHIIALFSVVMVTFVTQVYLIFAYKFGYFAIIGFLVIAIPTMMFFAAVSSKMAYGSGNPVIVEFLEKVGFAPAVISGYVIILLGALLSALLSTAFYKRPFSQNMINNTFKKAV